MDEPVWLTESDTIADMVNHPAFAGFGAHLIPRPQDAQSDLPLREVGRLMPWHSHVRPGIVTAALNRMIDDAMTGKAVFYPFHTEREKQERTGLFYYRGKPGAPFALIFPGGGFAYVGSLQGYSVWGGSAGARMAADLASYGAAAFGGEHIPRPVTVIMAYTGHNRYTENDPPTFAVVSLDDPIASPRVMERRIAALNAAGVDTEFHLYRNAGHGFGIGTGTDAEGWMDYAVHFWEQQLTKKK